MSFFFFGARFCALEEKGRFFVLRESYSVLELSLSLPETIGELLDNLVFASDLLSRLLVEIPIVDDVAGHMLRSRVESDDGLISKVDLSLRHHDKILLDATRSQALDILSVEVELLAEFTRSDLLGLDISIY